MLCNIKSCVDCQIYILTCGIKITRLKKTLIACFVNAKIITIALIGRDFQWG
jgi:hypothetical protein